MKCPYNRAAIYAIFVVIPPLLSHSTQHSFFRLLKHTKIINTWWWWCYVDAIQLCKPIKTMTWKHFALLTQLKSECSWCFAMISSEKDKEKKFCGKLACQLAYFLSPLLIFYHSICNLNVISNFHFEGWGVKGLVLFMVFALNVGLQIWNPWIIQNYFPLVLFSSNYCAMPKVPNIAEEDYRNEEGNYRRRSKCLPTWLSKVKNGPVQPWSHPTPDL